jgi:hypothetical protein
MRHAKGAGRFLALRRFGIAAACPISMGLIVERDLFDDANIAAEKHLYENHFHNQLKAARESRSARCKTKPPGQAHHASGRRG